MCYVRYHHFLASQEKFVKTKTVIALCNIRELSYIRMEEEGIDIGAGTTIGELREVLESTGIS